MAKPSFSQLEDAATTAINRAMAARDATEGVKSAVAANAAGKPLTPTPAPTATPPPAATLGRSVVIPSLRGGA